LKFFFVVIDGVDPWRRWNVRGVEPFELDIDEWEVGQLVAAIRRARRREASGGAVFPRSRRTRARDV